MNTIRYSRRECLDQDKINHFLSTSEVGFLGLANDDQPYVVPLNYVWWNERIYFHGADTGRKVTMMDNNPNVCFTVSQAYGTITDPVPAHTDTAYMSVMLFGRGERVTDLDEATAALQQMLNKYVPGYYDRPLSKNHVDKYRSSYGSGALIYRILPETISAKDNPVKPDHMFEEKNK
ncbi:pyridoxamine 5'-phosphate oxidase family protein [Paenibacillus albiflavus]|uniref:Pyridoxamine 5'-phosphate oxidase family protein n=1 Tax=Paenibacillus albiflavus TaxID=2545760 RepID=A0A4R4EKU4_9BACL|nr:pyridoxamine 5'-phosphate oxidase family protein [Paenibacillus albiflavus]TCZ80113.1 pyridoxamine 5'-phosphate oxidase family protein [Paenibacillus albiflavus]